MPYDARLKHLNLFSFQGRLLRADLFLTYKIFHDLCAIKVADVFQLMTDGSTRGHRYKICLPLAHRDARKRFFAVRVVPWWNGLSSNTVTATSLDSFKRRLHEDLGDELFKYLD